MERKGLFQKIYLMLTKRQKFNFIIIIFIMIICALLSQLLPLAIGTLTDDILGQESLSFIFILPFLGFILVITIINEILKVLRRIIVEDTCTRCEKTA